MLSVRVDSLDRRLVQLESVERRMNELSDVNRRLADLNDLQQRVAELETSQQHNTADDDGDTTDVLSTTNNLDVLTKQLNNLTARMTLAENQLTLQVLLIPYYNVCQLAYFTKCAVVVVLVIVVVVVVVAGVSVLGVHRFLLIYLLCYFKIILSV